MTRRLVWLTLSLLALSGCPNPAAPPAPPAEIPTALTIPGDISINVNELQTPSSQSGALKAQVYAAPDVRNAIDVSTTAIEDANQLLDISLLPIAQHDIPVDASLKTYSFDTTFHDTSFQVKIDFSPFDLDGDGTPEACSGCTCPAGCAPDLAACPTEAPEDQLKPICMRLWLNGVPYMAGVFDHVPTADNPQSGRLRFLIPTFADLAGSNLAITYDHSDPQDKTTDLSIFFKDLNDPTLGDTFFGRSKSFGNESGPDTHVKKTAKLTTQNFDELTSTLQFQSQYFSDLDLVLLEDAGTGEFGASGLSGNVNITPPLCAEISTADPVADILCTDIGLSLTQGDFVSLPELTDIQFPPDTAFPVTPTF